MEADRESDRYKEGRALANAYMKGMTNRTIHGTLRKRRAELRTSQEQVNLQTGYNDRIREISNMSMFEIDDLIHGE